MRFLSVLHTHNQFVLNIVTTSYSHSSCIEAEKHQMFNDVTAFHRWY